MILMECLKLFTIPSILLTKKQHSGKSKLMKASQLSMKCWCAVWWVTKLSFLPSFSAFHKATFSANDRGTGHFPAEQIELKFAGGWKYFLSSPSLLLAPFSPEQPQTLESIWAAGWLRSSSALICGGSCSPTPLSAAQINTEFLIFPAFLAYLIKIHPCCQPSADSGFVDVVVQHTLMLCAALK